MLHKFFLPEEQGKLSPGPCSVSSQNVTGCGSWQFQCECTWQRQVMHLPCWYYWC